ncbi:MAG: sigma-54-dependent Fis family transcriptional regulator [Myxococcales bacterium]|nr:sigma-54-dependent Fis family transcriptional regulator [Myxococcales bacterium]
MKPRVRIIEGDAESAVLLADQLGVLGWQVETFASAEAGLAGLETAEVDAVLTVLELGTASGVDVCRAATAARPDVPVLLMTSYGTLTAAVGAMRAGAHDFLIKPLTRDVLDVAFTRALEYRRLRQELTRLRREVGPSSGHAGLLGQSPPMQRVYTLIDRLGPSSASVLIRGDSGVGKELVARALHARSRRADGPFVAINCAAVPEKLLESELFGHEKGAFTGADRPRAGLFREAQGGTLFLDEIGEMSAALQPKLLRALQERRIRPVGADHEVPVDVRVIAATHQDLGQALRAGRFRTDLYYRLAVVLLDVPPLRARGEDIVAMAEAFLGEICARDDRPLLTLSHAATTSLVLYDWPGNVRELKNAMEHAAAFAAGPLVHNTDLPPAIAGDALAEAESPAAAPGFLSLDEMERRHILRVFDAVGQNKSETARILGIDRKTLHAKLARYGRDQG